MLKKHLLLCLAVLGGAGGIALRRYQWSTAFEAGPLPIKGAPASIAIAIFSLLMLALFCFLARGAATEETALHTQPQPSFFALLFTWAAAAVTLWTAVSLWNGSKLLSPVSFLFYLLIVIMAASAPAIALLGARRYQGRSSRASVALLLPAYASCLFLMVSYQGWAGDPFVIDYVFSLFAIVAGLLAHYFIATHTFYRSRSPWILICGAMSIFLSMIALAGSNVSRYESLSEISRACLDGSQLFFAAQVLYFVPTLLLFAQQHPSLRAAVPQELGATDSASTAPDADTDTQLQEVPPDVT